MPLEQTSLRSSSFATARRREDSGFTYSPYKLGIGLSRCSATLGTQETMILRRVITAFIVSTLGTFVLYILGIVLMDLVSSVYGLVSCAIGSLISTIVFSNPKNISFKSNINIAVGIVFITFLFISAGHTAEQIYKRKVAVDFEPIGILIWATLATSWWLIPLTAVVLSTINSRFNIATNYNEI